MISINSGKILLLYALILIWCCQFSSAADSDSTEENVYYVCGEEIQEPDCVCENDVMICQRPMNYGKNFQSANVVILKPNFVAKNVTFGRADISSLKNNEILPGREGTLEQLVISTRNLTFIENRAFDNFTSLKSLGLIGTNMTSITDAIFTETLGSRLAELDLSSNEFKFISSINFKYLTNLKSLNLHGSKFGQNYSTSLDVFPKALANLETLNLADCGFEVLNSSIFVNLVNLKTLILNNNQLTSMPTAINYLPALQNLHMENSNITVLNNTGLSINDKLEKLVITKSKLLTSIEDCAFCSFPNLKFFHFWDNKKLSFIDENAFGYAKNGTSPKIEAFSLEHCNLQIIPEKLLDWKNVAEIGVGGNNFMCNCSLAWLVNNIHELKLVEVFSHPFETYYHQYHYYYPSEIRENTLQCYGPLGLDKIHFSMITGNLCMNKENQDNNCKNNSAPHHVFCYALCGILVFVILVAALSYPIKRFYLKSKNSETANPLGYENSNFNEEDSEVVNNQFP